MEVIFTAYILHNFLLSLKDSWNPTIHEKREIIQSIQAAYDRMKDSRWGQDIVHLNRDGLQRSQDQDRALGQAKRDALINHILDWRQNRIRTHTMRILVADSGLHVLRFSLILIRLIYKYQR